MRSMRRDLPRRNNGQLIAGNAYSALLLIFKSVLMSTTYSGTYTITNAQYLASKIAADLKQMQLFYGRPIDTEIDNFVQELVILLKDGYLESIDYGFKKEQSGSWILALSYAVNPLTGTLDQNPGRIPPGSDITGASFYSFRRFSSKYANLLPTERQKIDALNPIKWSIGLDPLTGLFGTHDRSYSSGGQQIDRKIIQK